MYDTYAIVIQILLLALSLSFICARFYVRLITLHDKPHLSDYLVCISWLFALAFVICFILSYEILGASTDEAGLTKLYKVYYATAPIFDAGPYFAKASLLAFYWGLFPTCLPKLRLGFHIVTGYIAAAGLTIILIDLLWCTPMSENWSLEPDSCSVYNSWVTFDTSWGLNISSDLALFIPPFFLLKDLKLGKWQKAGLATTFTLGAITMSMSIARLIWFYQDLSVAPGSIWCTAELCTAIIVVCLPPLKILFHSPDNTGTSSRNAIIRDSDGRSSTRKISLVPSWEEMKYPDSQV